MFFLLNLNVTAHAPITQQKVSVNNRVAWVSKVQEFDLEIKPMKLLRG